MVNKIKSNQINNNINVNNKSIFSLKQHFQIQLNIILIIILGLGPCTLLKTLLFCFWYCIPSSIPRNLSIKPAIFQFSQESWLWRSPDYSGMSF